jgi:excisionase family DNA binding protein
LDQLLIGLLVIEQNLDPYLQIIAWFSGYRTYPKKAGGPGAILRRIMKSLYSVEEISQFLKLSKSSVYSLVQQGKIPFVKVGRRLRFEPEEVLSFFKKKVKEKDIEQGAKSGR